MSFSNANEKKISNKFEKSVSVFTNLCEKSAMMNIRKCNILVTLCCFFDYFTYFFTITKTVLTSHLNNHTNNIPDHILLHKKNVHMLMHQKSGKAVKKKYFFPGILFVYSFCYY